MSFRVNARTVLQLGEELISSDAIALYELIKNAFDAGSRKVEVSVSIDLTQEVLNEAESLLDGLAAKEKPSKGVLSAIHETVSSGLEGNTDQREKTWGRFLDCETVGELRQFLEEANRIEVIDQGEGMTLDELDSVFLTIGTRSRQQEKGRKGSRPLLGEKGLGRLSTMRLGNRLIVETTTQEDSHWNVLEIDWRLFSHDSDELIDSIKIAPHTGKKKVKRDESGTTIKITSLKSTWDKDKVRSMSDNEFAKLRDPFEVRKDFPLRYRYNGDPIAIVGIDSDILDCAHAICEARYSCKGSEVSLTGVTDYKRFKRKRPFSLKGAHILQTSDAVSMDALREVGDFEVKFYWYNRQYMREQFEGMDYTRLKAGQARWAGGLLLYRDGFRVHPYGSLDDDWLDLDRKALSFRSYKVNRRQVIGRVRISSSDNPHLIDQTNREGLRDSPEKEAFIHLLQQVFVEFRAFMNTVDEEQKEAKEDNIADLSDAMERTGRELNKRIKLIVRDIPKLSDHREFEGINDDVDKIRRILEKGRKIVSSMEDSRERVIHLAAIGLMVEAIGHDLNRSAAHLLALLHEHRKTGSGSTALFTAIESQVKTLQKRLSILDPLSTSGRQRKERFDLIKWINEVVRLYESQMKRHSISWDIKVRPKAVEEKGMEVYMVKGMLIQILDNIINNSIYWLKAQAILDGDAEGHISIEVDASARTVSISDNGPGVPPENADIIFEPHYSTKPAHEGKGLGLYIAREVAKYNQCKLTISDEESKSGNLNTFILQLPEDAT